MADNSKNKNDHCGGCDSDCGRVVGPYCALRPSGLSAFGGLYNNAEQSITIKEGCAEVIDLPQEMASCNVKYGTNSITIKDGGKYRIDFMAVLKSTQGPIDTTIAVRINCVESPPLTLGIVLGTEFECVSAFSIFSLDSCDVLDLVISSSAGGCVLFGPALNASLCAMRLANC